MNRRKQKTNSVVMADEGAGYDCNKLEQLTENKSFTESGIESSLMQSRSVKDDKVMSEAKRSIDKVPAFVTETTCCDLCFLPFCCVGVMGFMLSECISDKWESLVEAYPSLMHPIAISFVLFGLAQQFVVFLSLMYLKKWNKTFFAYALLNLVPAISRLLTHLAAHMYPGDVLFYLSILSNVCNGIILFVGLVIPGYASVMGISVIIGIFLFYMGQGLLYDIVLVVLLVVPRLYNFNFMIYTESDYVKYHRARDGDILKFFLLGLLIIFLWNIYLEES